MNQILEVAIGLALVFAVASLGASVLVEWLSAILAMRGKLLWKGIENIVGSYCDDLCAHPLLQSLTRRTWFDDLFPYLKRAKPSYIPAKTFSAALLGVLQEAPGDDWLATVSKLPKGPLKKALQPLVAQAAGDLDRAQASFEHWFDTAMDRVTGWYKRWTQLVLFCLGLGVALWFGVDSVQIGQALWTDESLREKVVEVATADWDECQGIDTPAPAGVGGPQTAKTPSTGGGGDQAGQTAPAGVGEEAAARGPRADGGVAPASTTPKTGGSKRECVEKYRSALTDAQLPLVPFRAVIESEVIDSGGKGKLADESEGSRTRGAATSIPRRTTTLAPWEDPAWVWLTLGFAAVLIWLDLRHRRPQASISAPRPKLMVQGLLFAGRLLVLLALAAGAAVLIVVLVDRFWHPRFGEWLIAHAIGFLLTAFAVSFGAPFWFDTLGRLIKLRASGARPQPPAPGESTAASPGAPAPSH